MSLSHTQTVLITAAGGNIGSALVPKLLQHDFKLVLPTSDAARLQSKLTATANSDRVTIESGSIKDAKWVQRILIKHTVDVVFLCLTGTDELFTTLNFLDAMQRAGHIKQLIYVSACGDFVSAKGVEDLMRAHSAAHVLVKSTIEQKLIYGAFPWKTTRLGPLLFVSDDLRSKESMLKDGLFDEPLGKEGVGRVFESDIALAACNAILAPELWAGKKINIGSLRRYKGSEIAEMWSRAIERTASMCGNDDDGLSTLEDRVEAHIGQRNLSGWGRDLRLMYEAFGSVGFGMTQIEYESQISLLGKEPEDYAKRVEETQLRIPSLFHRCILDSHLISTYLPNAPEQRTLTPTYWTNVSLIDISTLLVLLSKFSTVTLRMSWTIQSPQASYSCCTVCVVAKATTL
jgi:nucleoside-diphosphate-sugar epimerase